MPHFNYLDSISSWPGVFDAEAADIGRENWLTTAQDSADSDVADLAVEITKNPAGRAITDSIFGNSPFLTLIAARDPAFLCDLLRFGPDHMASEILQGLSEKRKQSINGDTLGRDLRVARRRMALTVAMADISGHWALSAITTKLAEFADASMSAAFAHLLREGAGQGAFTLADDECPERESGLIVLGMGKLGAFELNYSSDIDLIILFDAEKIETGLPDKLQNNFVRLARNFVKIMDDRTTEGYVFRTDLRLRPDPGATPLALSVAAAETYYESIGQNWERAAMIKARPVAGDLEAGQAFLKFLTPFVWRKNLDFAAIQDIHSIKRQINANAGGDEISAAGHNIKLGQGGIREIEFFAQTQQLIWGGREPGLRSPSTVQALADLAQFGHCEDQTARELTDSYAFLRRVEHRLQMINDEQTQTLPDRPEEFTRLTTFLGYDTPQAFEHELVEHLQRTRDHYARLFADAPGLGRNESGNLVFTGADTDPDTRKSLAAMGFDNPDRVDAIIRTWHHGRYRATRSTRAREILTELMPRLLAAMAETPDPDSAFLQFDEFLRGLPAGIQLFSMIQAYPQLLDLLAEIMGTAPRLARHLSNRPSVLDSVLSPDFFQPLPNRAALSDELRGILARAEFTEDVLNLSRRWAHDRRFQVGVQCLQGAVSAAEAARALSNIAETAVNGLYEPVAAEFEAQHGRFPGGAMAVLALGKLGSREMTASSDLDLVFIYRVTGDAVASDGDKPLAVAQYFARLSQRLINALTALTAEGGLYEVDMRLRPSGNSGPIATTLDSFIKYQDEQAWTWEHMALTRARVVAATDPGLRDDVNTAIARVLAKPRDPDRLLGDVASMRDRLAGQKPATSIWSLKQLRGGVVDIEFIAQYELLRNLHDHPELAAPTTRAALEQLSEAGILAVADTEVLTGAIDLWQDLQSMLSLTVEDDIQPDRVDRFSSALKSRLADAGGCATFEDLEQKIERTAAAAHGIFSALIEKPAADLPEGGEDIPLPE